MFKYLCSVSVNVLEAYITGHPFCNNTAPSPCFDASHCIVCSAFGSKYARTGSVVTALFMPSNTHDVQDPISTLCLSCITCLMVVLIQPILEYILRDSLPYLGSFTIQSHSLEVPFSLWPQSYPHLP